MCLCGSRAFLYSCPTILSGASSTVVGGGMVFLCPFLSRTPTGPYDEGLRLFLYLPPLLSSFISASCALGHGAKLEKKTLHLSLTPPLNPASFFPHTPQPVLCNLCLHYRFTQSLRHRRSRTGAPHALTHCPSH